MSRPAIAKPFIRSPFLSDMIILFDTLRLIRKQYGVASCVLLTGESGSGKTELATNYVKKNPAVEEEERTHIPVFHFQLRTVSTDKEFLKSMLIAIGDPQQGLHGDKSDLYKRLVGLIKIVGCELLILDEIHTIFERRSMMMLAVLAKMFRFLIDDTEVPIVFMGMPWSRHLVSVDSQLTRRVSHKFSFPPFRISNADDRNDYRRLLKLLAEAYGMSAEIKLEESALALRCFAATDGNMAATSRLIRDAYIKSDIERRRVDVKLFAEVLCSYGVNDESNAFLVSMDGLVLRELIVHSGWRFGHRAGKNSIIAAEYAEYGVSKGNRLYSLSA